MPHGAVFVFGLNCVNQLWPAFVLEISALENNAGVIVFQGL